MPNGFITHELTLSMAVFGAAVGAMITVTETRKGWPLKSQSYQADEWA
jgi:hypothetical protein